MDREQLAGILSGCGLPVVYRAWPDGSQPSFPCIRYIQEARDDFHADNRAYLKRSTWSVILVSERKDDAHESALEELFEGNGIPFERVAETWIDAEKLLQVEYEITTI